uniref:Uncharacterized protein n=1 Tax=Glossina brevipalpis TaxID=37001 RepID=A0A1A9X386_9MUSC
MESEKDMVRFLNFIKRTSPTEKTVNNGTKDYIERHARTRADRAYAGLNLLIFYVASVSLFWAVTNVLISSVYRSAPATLKISIQIDCSKRDKDENVIRQWLP